LHSRLDLSSFFCLSWSQVAQQVDVDGRSDYALFYGKDPQFLKWATDLFLYYWNQGKPCYPTK
jgi:predicted transcriptional regulator